MLVKVADLTRNKGTTFRYDFLLPLMDADVSEVQVPEPVRVRVEAVCPGEGKGIRLEGRFGSRVKARCHRCAEEYELDLSSDFREVVELLSDTACVREDDGPCRGEGVDLALMAREHWILALPLKLLCREDCRGICPRCGSDLAESPCRCGEEALDPRLEKLKDLLPE